MLSWAYRPLIVPPLVVPVENTLPFGDTSHEFHSHSYSPSFS